MARAYDNANRASSARETRTRIVDTARELLLDGGYTAMTVAALAHAAQVSPQTVYNSIGGKAEVVKAVYDVLLAGDDDATPMSSRPEFVAMGAASDGAAFARAYAAWTRSIYDGVGPLLGVLLAHGAAGDPVLEEFVATIDRERRTGNKHAITNLGNRFGLPAGRSREHLIDAIWVLTAPEVHDRLVRRAGWSPRTYEEWLGAQLAVMLVTRG